MAQALTNVWHLRTVAESSSKPCLICFKPTTAVLITPDNKDHFYVCRGHLTDKGFCSPIIDEAEAAAKKRKEALEREIELVTKEYEEKLKKKKAKNKSTKDKEKDGEKKVKEKEGDADDADDKQAEKEKDDKIKALTTKDTQSTANTEGIPRIYALQKNFYQMRLDRIRNAEIAKRNRERLRNPATFPSVPAGDI